MPLLLKGSGVRLFLVLQRLLKLLVGPLELIVVQKQLPKHRGPSIGAILKRGKELVWLVKNSCRLKLSVGFLKNSCRVKLDKNLGDWMPDFVKILSVGFCEDPKCRIS